MAEIVRAQVVLAGTSMLPEDAFVNRWHFQVETSPPPAGTLTAISTALETFYESQASALTTQSITGNVLIKYYNLADPLPRRPIVEHTFTISGMVATSALPQETAICVSFEAQPVSGTPQARRRNRIYMGGWIPGILAADGRVSNATTTGISNAANALLTASNAAADWSWIVRSEEFGSVAPVLRGWVDNAVDTQRRRGKNPTFRDPFP